MNSAASRHVETPPIPDMGSPGTSRAMAATIWSAMGFTAGPQYPPFVDASPTRGKGTIRSRSTPMRLLIVLMSETPSAPPSRAARAASTMSPVFGVNLTRTGVRATSLTQRVISVMSFGSWPIVEPMPRSHIPCGQPKLSSSPSQPEPSTLRTSVCQSRRVSAMSETTITCFGKRCLTSRISRRFTSSGLSVMSSMLLKPITLPPP